MWGIPVVTSPVMTVGTGLVGAFGVDATIYDREQARVTFTEAGLGDNAGEELFMRNQVRFRGESRIALGVARPASFCSVTGL
jgi:HK97 family phage major capsid protein